MRGHPADSPDADERLLAGARLRGRRAALAAILVVAVAFVGASTVQISLQVFGGDVQSLAGTTPEERACAEGVRRLAVALEDGAWEIEAQAPSEHRPPVGQRAGAVEQACDGSRAGRQAWAALLRLRSAEEQLTRRNRLELDPLRREVAAHLPANLR